MNPTETTAVQGFEVAPDARVASDVRDASDVPDAPDAHDGPRPRRADAQRNYEKIVAAAREAFAARGASTSLEEIARRAGVGIGTLYRNFPSRQGLLEAVYVDEVEAVCRSAETFATLDPWDGLSGWLHQVVGYLATKQALAQELLDYLDRDAPLFKTCRTTLYSVGEPLLARAQAAKVVRADTNLPEIIQMVGGIAKIAAPEPGQIEHILEIALDGLRYRSAD